MSRMRAPARWAALAFALTGLGLLGGQSWTAAKAALSRLLIADAFERHLADGEAHPPWPWADMHPIARLTVERLGITRYVLTGASGTSLAFGLGHLDGSARPGETGNCVIAGHRDTRASFLGRLDPGDTIRVVTRAGTTVYRVLGGDVVDRDDVRVLEDTRDGVLTLVTCWPLDGLLRGKQRYVLVAALTPS